MELNRQEIKLIGDCILDEIETYTPRDIIEDNERFKQLVSVVKKFVRDFEHGN